jgi:glutamine amidotransferase
MINLGKLGLITPIIDHVMRGKPIMGVCLGMQLLFEKSQEFGNHFGLGLIKGEVIRFRKKSKLRKVPQIGWNKIKFNNHKESKFFNGISNLGYMYFVHSFYVIPNDEKVVFSITEYNGIEYCSSILKDNIFRNTISSRKEW